MTELNAGDGGTTASADMMTWDEEYDVVVVGSGLAGTCAALEAAAGGARVLVVERYNGGGTSAVSAGVVYAGGGTKQQVEAGREDSPQNMFDYLRHEVRDAVSEATLRRFSEESAGSLAWLEQHGVRFAGRECPFKTSYPPFTYTLYYSGNETEPPYNKDAVPAPRGHMGDGTAHPGSRIMSPLRDALPRNGVEVRCQTAVRELITDASGGVAGVRIAGMPPESRWTRVHWWLYRISIFARYINMFIPGLAAALKAAAGKLEKAHAQPRCIRARRGVVLAAGGFVFNRPMVGRYAPAYARAMPLGSIGDDGAGILLGQSVGGAIARMDRVSAWRFLNPPETFTQGVLVDKLGQRICNERLYGAQITDIMVKRHRSEGTLIIDHALWKKTFSMIGPSRVTWFQFCLAFPSLFLNKRSWSIGRLAERLGIPPIALLNTIEEYNRVARERGEDPMGKKQALLQPIETPPFYAIDSSINDAWFGCPSITMGGLVVDEDNGQVRREDGSRIPGLYAAGRTAVGLPTESYVSGLSLGDCVFSGRRAGRHAAGSAAAAGVAA